MAGTIITVNDNGSLKIEGDFELWIRPVPHMIWVEGK